MKDIAYFIRVACRWVKVTTSVTEWARLPHFAGSLACKATGLLLLSALAGSVPSIGPSTAIPQPRLPSQIARAASYSPPEDSGMSVVYTPMDDVEGNDRSGSSPSGILGSSFLYPPAPKDVAADNLSNVTFGSDSGGPPERLPASIGGSPSVAGGLPSGYEALSPRLERSPPVAERSPPGVEAVPSGPGAGTTPIGRTPIGPTPGATVPPVAQITPPNPVILIDTPAPDAPLPVDVPEPNSIILLGLAVAVLTGGRQIARRKPGKLKSRE